MLESDNIRKIRYTKSKGDCVNKIIKLDRDLIGLLRGYRADCINGDVEMCNAYLGRLTGLLGLVEDLLYEYDEFERLENILCD